MRNTFLLLALASLISACGESGRPAPAKVTQVPNPAASEGLYPFLASDASGGNALMAWYEPDSGHARSESDRARLKLLWAAYDGTDWTAPELITAGDQFFVNWADFPSLTQLDGAPLAAHWPKKVSGGIYAYHVNMAFRTETGAWSEPITPHQDLSATEHGFVSMLPVDRNRVLALWLDGYRTQAPVEGEGAHDGHGGDAVMTLHSAMVHRDGSLAKEVEVDDSVCDCCQTAMARAGNRIIAVYRNRTSDEIRDIYRAVYDLDEGRWSEPVALSNDGWKIAGCPVNGPQIAAHGDTVIAAWFTAANDQPRSYMAVSTDGGLTFGQAVGLDNGSSIGRVGIAFNDSGEALLSWIGAHEEPSRVYGRLWREAGLEVPFVIGEIDGSRASGFPRLAGLGNGFLVAWTEPVSASGIKTVRVQSIP